MVFTVQMKSMVGQAALETLVDHFSGFCMIPIMTKSYQSLLECSALFFGANVRAKQIQVTMAESRTIWTGSRAMFQKRKSVGTVMTIGLFGHDNNIVYCI